MIYGKLENGNIIRAPKGIETPEGAWHIPPTEEMLLEMGFKPVIFTDMPTKEGYYYVAEWAEEKGKIVRKWVEQKAPEETPLTDPQEARITELEKEVAELKAKLEEKNA